MKGDIVRRKKTKIEYEVLESEADPLGRIFVRRCDGSLYDVVYEYEVEAVIPDHPTPPDTWVSLTNGAIQCFGTYSYVKASAQRNKRPWIACITAQGYTSWEYVK